MSGVRFGARYAQFGPAGSQDADGLLYGDREGSGPPIIGRRSDSESSGNGTAETRPAPTKADAVPAVRAPMSTPIDAGTMNGSEVACRRPAATTDRGVPSSLR